MKNQEIIQDIVSYIYDAMRKKGIDISWTC